MSFVEQLTAITLLVDFLFGVTFGVMGGAIRGSRRGVLLAPASDDLVSAGARVIFGVFARDDDGYLRSLLSGHRHGSGDPRGDSGSAPQGQGQGADR